MTLEARKPQQRNLPKGDGRRSVDAPRMPFNAIRGGTGGRANGPQQSGMTRRPALFRDDNDLRQWFAAGNATKVNRNRGYQKLPGDRA